MYCLTHTFLTLLLHCQHTIFQCYATRFLVHLQLTNAQCPPQASTPTGDTALHLAARRRDVDMARILVDYGAVVDATNGFGQTALHIAAAEGDEPLVKYFYGVRANAAITDNEGAPIDVAILKLAVYINSSYRNILNLTTQPPASL